MVGIKRVKGWKRTATDRVSDGRGGVLDRGLTDFEGPNMTLLTQMRCMTGMYLFYSTDKVTLVKV